jgi:hypothetical protein
MSSAKLLQAEPSPNGERQSPSLAAEAPVLTSLCRLTRHRRVNRPARIGASALSALEVSVGAINSIFSFLAPQVGALPRARDRSFAA